MDQELTYVDCQVVLQEVPDNISLCFSICGCPLSCKGCHSPFLRKKENGQTLTNQIYKNYIEKYEGFISCVLFMGGEWCQRDLIEKLKIAKKYGLETCLYTGMDDVSEDIKKHLTWIKTGPWIQELGGLESHRTNQRFIEVKTGKILNSKFLNNPKK